MNNADLIEVIKTLADSIAKEAADALAAADKRIAELEARLVQIRGDDAS